MTHTTPTLHQQIASRAPLSCAVAKRFVSRPSLLEIVSEVLIEQWVARGLDIAHSPLRLYLISPATSRHAHIRSVPQVLIERFCLRRTLNLTEGEDYLSPLPLADRSSQLDLDLHTVEQLINECAPWILDQYQQALVAFWGESNAHGETPWQWYGNYLHKLMKDSIDLGLRAGTLDTRQAATSRIVDAFPCQQDRAAFGNLSHLRVQSVAVDLSCVLVLDADLSSALLIEDQYNNDPQQTAAILFTLVGALVPFKSHGQFLDFLGQNWPAHLQHTPARVIISPSPGCAFAAQARGYLQQQLRLIDTIAANARTEQHATALSTVLDQVTSMLDLCTAQELVRQAKIKALLPDWLLGSDLALRYSLLLSKLAELNLDGRGTSWREGIEAVEVYACRLLDQRLALDHADVDFKAGEIEIINHRVDATAIGNQGTVITDGTVTVVHFSLAQLAIDNLGLLAPGRVMVEHSGGARLPEWMNETYIRTLVGELDIGSRYPQTLRQLLLEPGQQQRRQALFTAQLQVQLPMHALELLLQDKAISEAGYKAVEWVFANHADLSPDNHNAAVLRPLALIRSPGAIADPVLNAWLIEPREPWQGPCMLYRPLHPQTLQEFDNRTALFDAICSEGPLQDDILDRLAPEVRPLYAKGGFLQPHIQRFGQGSDFAPQTIPAPATLAFTLAAEAPGTLIYQACARELIEQAQRQSTTTSQTRWNRWKTLGWLLFNTVLPLFQGNVARIGWLIQTVESTQHLLATDAGKDPLDHQLAFVDLLLTIAMIILVHVVRRDDITTQLGKGLPLQPAQSPGQATPLAPFTPLADIDLDFTWSRPGLHLSSAQKADLQGLASTLNASTLGSAIPHGALMGLHLHNESLWFVTTGQVFKVVLDPLTEQPRIVAADGTERFGPWLRKDEAGRWTLDLRLRLQGGMPLRQRLKSVNDPQRVLELDNNLREQQASAITRERNFQTFVTNHINDQTPALTLYAYVTKLEQFATFWEDHLNTLEQRNEIRVLKGYKLARAKALRGRARCVQSILATVNNLHKPLRQRFKALVRSTHGKLPPEQEASAPPEHIRLMDEMEPLIAKMIDNTLTLSSVQLELHKLASAQHPEIQLLELSVKQFEPQPWSKLYWHTLRCELLNNRLRLSLDDDTSEDADYWLERSWGNLEHGLVQRMSLHHLAEPPAEVRARLLDTIANHFRAALRQLGNLKPLLTEAAAQGVLERLNSDAALLLRETQSDLDEYPQSLLEHSSVRQLHNQVPGLIETADQGLVLGTPRADNADIVDVRNPQDQTTSASYQRDANSDAWLPVEPGLPAQPVAESAPTTASLGTLISHGARLAAQAREEISRLSALRTDTYLPIEFEEILQRRKRPVEAQGQAIEQALSRLNLTDQAEDGADAALQIRQLDELAGDLDQAAAKLRTQAALVQSPSMDELIYLLGKQQVRIQALGRRKLLAKNRKWPRDYLDEYVILHDNRPLWYAHFHYSAADTPKDSFTAGHLKLASQRYERGPYRVEANGSRTVVQRGPITLAQARCWFLTL
ncbi:dermonecrotic toxin domain-containing protein [Pseudomonas fluorescens]|uniref:Dermonecrotic toxin N-terminal domain-containing protein n=1 Tax=Pseudomonas fluorescens TaxID=294 RepID=A0A5E6V4S9_PSEFL|nr:DUF6543 domain-containing protein [Pseudomonas fluorescens]VVN12783.1 hypothetical protein PS652_03895 [Pseudomonas fluorescens]